VQRDLWGNPLIKCGEFFVYHDESVPTKRWLLIGLLFVDSQRQTSVEQVLRYHRYQESYTGEVHFSELPGSFGGVYGAKARVALRWMRTYQETLKEDAFFTALAVDRHSPAYEHRRFSKDFHAYNRFTAMALRSGIAWHLGPRGFDELKLTFVSDAKDRASRPDRDTIDNFEDYIPYRAQLDSFLAQASGKAYPRVSTKLELRDSAEDDLLQLTDLLLGATQEALVGSCSRRTKRHLGQIVASWCRELKKPPWEQNPRMHRRFDLWAFPDSNGRPYREVPLALDPGDRQLLMFPEPKR